MFRTSFAKWVVLSVLSGLPFTALAQVSTNPPPCSFGLSPSNAVYSAEGGSGAVTVSTQDGCVWSVFTGDAWIHISSSPTNVGSGNVIYSVDANDAFSSRVGSIRIDGRIFYV